VEEGLFAAEAAAGLAAKVMTRITQLDQARFASGLLQHHDVRGARTFLIGISIKLVEDQSFTCLVLSLNTLALRLESMHPFSPTRAVVFEGSLCGIQQHASWG
jgi:hypothetical protein